MKRFTRLSLVSGLAVAGVLSVVIAGSAATSDGAVHGRVFECGPGPIVVSPGRPAQKAIPATVTLRHDGRNVERIAISFPASAPWSGPFTFNVPAGRYEVISSYLHQTAWAVVRNGVTSQVHFGPFACPMQSAS
jgi:hypothetical protein